jgi:hypothetical protein
MRELFRRLQVQVGGERVTSTTSPQRHRDTENNRFFLTTEVTESTEKRHYNSISYKLILILIVVLLPFAAQAEEITGITIRDKNFEVINDIRDEKMILRFQDHWNKKTKIDAEALRAPIYKIDINPGNRWLYDLAGYVQVLSKAKVPIYQLHSPEEFNALLGIPGNKINSQK